VPVVFLHDPIEVRCTRDGRAIQPRCRMDLVEENPGCTVDFSRVADFPCACQLQIGAMNL
jgi:hypothetical protein